MEFEARLRPSRALATVAIGMLLLGACNPSAASPAASVRTPLPSVAAPSGSSSPSASEDPFAGPAGGEPAEATAISAGILVSASLTPPWLALQKGYFEEEGLEVTLETITSNPQGLQLLSTGDLQFSHSPYMNTAQGIEGGFDLVAVSNNDSSTDGTDVGGRRDVFGILVKTDSGIDSEEDLNGKIVGVTSVPSLIWMFSSAAIDAAGGDSESINFVPVPLPNMCDALLGGTADAIGVLEPWITTCLATGEVKAIAFPYVDVSDNRPMSLGGFVALRPFAEENPNTVRRFIHAVQRAMNDLGADETYAREMIAEFTGMEAALVDSIWIPPLSTAADVETIELQLELMLSKGLLQQPIDVADMLWEETILNPATPPGVTIRPQS